eukprot:9476959-Pyramimonas_sp.AAC.1
MTCQGLWPLARARAAGYDIPDLCPLCHAPGDTVFHRLWSCPVVEEERGAIADEHVLAAVRNDPDVIN